MGGYFLFILLCLLHERTVNGQMLVSHMDGVIVTSSSQQGTHGRFDIKHVVDGNTRTDADVCKCCGATTDIDVNPWFKVDLGQEYMIQRIHVLGRTDYRNTLYKLEIQLGTTESDGTVLVTISDTSINELDFILKSPEHARYITLTLRNRKEYLVICELYVYADCNDGRYGPTCIEECGNCNNNVVCNKSNGDCSSGCSVGYQGTTCKEVCSSGTYGLGCAYTCGRCENNSTCNNVDGTCTGCATGYLSPMCKDCIDGRYSSTCNENCGKCINVSACDRGTGTCSGGCSAGFKGDICKEACSLGTYGLDCAQICGNCEYNETCDNVYGACKECVTGYISPMCRDCIDERYGPTCNEECGHCNNTDVCDKGNGNCQHGCSAGYKGTTCKKECEDRTFGLGCEEKCGNCFNNGPCNNIDGSCTACAAGYKESTCLIECHAGTFGFNCKQHCGMCQDGAVCDIYTGECPNGCTDEYKGSQCSQEITQDTSISIPVFIGSLFAVIVVTIPIVIGLVRLFYRKRLNKKTHTNKSANNEDTSSPPSNYDKLRFDNPDGKSTYTELNRRS